MTITLGVMNTYNYVQLLPKSPIKEQYTSLAKV